VGSASQTRPGPRGLCRDLQCALWPLPQRDALHVGGVHWLDARDAPLFRVCPLRDASRPPGGAAPRARDVLLPCGDVLPLSLTYASSNRFCESYESDMRISG